MRVHVLLSLLFLLALQPAGASNDTLESFTICFRTMFTHFPEYRDLIVLDTREITNVSHSSWSFGLIFNDAYNNQYGYLKLLRCISINFKRFQGIKITLQFSCVWANNTHLSQETILMNLECFWKCSVISMEIFGWRNTFSSIITTLPIYNNLMRSKDTYFYQKSGTTIACLTPTPPHLYFRFL